MVPSSSQAQEPHPLRAYRARHGYSLLDLATRAGLSEPGLSRIEAGRVELPSFAILVRLAMATQGEVSEFDIFRWHLAHHTGVVAPLRAPMTQNFNWSWVRSPAEGSAPAAA